VNRQTKRQLQRSGADQRPRAPQPRRPATGAPERERVGPRQYLGEVRGELRKVAWPTREEVLNSTLVVLVAVAFLTGLIFGFDFVSAKFVLFLYD
jgi:preprotein translocase subunit SecE